MKLTVLSGNFVGMRPTEQNHMGRPHSLESHFFSRAVDLKVLDSNSSKFYLLILREPVATIST